MFPLQVIQIAFGLATLLVSLVAPAVASPYSLPLPLVNRNTASLSPKAHPNTSLAYRQTAVFPINVDTIESRDDGPAICDLIAVITLFKYRFTDLAHRARIVDPADPDFHHETASALRGLADALAPLNANRGLANLRKGDSVEECLRNLIGSLKEILNLVYEIVKDIPIVGPILGPIVYDAKCILDSVLNFSEELTDGTLNAVYDVLGIYSAFVCGPGALNALDICVDLPTVLPALGLGL